jgi:RHS repeat-associated protein
VPNYIYNSSNELTSNSSGSYTYDANGNTLTDVSGRSFTWDFENRLTQAVVPGTNGGTTTFKYDPFGRRIQKSGPLGTTNYLYDGSNSIEEVDNGGNVVARYARTKNLDEPLGELRSATTSYYQQDGLGSVTSLSNSAGALTKTYTYDNYGRVLSSTGTLVSPFQYTGREFDSETTLLFNRARYFDPSAGRFISEDPLRFVGGLNLYGYTRNNPVLRVDPSGYQGCSPAQWAQSPGACAGPQDPDGPYQGPDGLWYNVQTDWQIGPSTAPPDDGPTPPPSPTKPGTCPCEHDARYYSVVADVESEYDWTRVKTLAWMVGVPIGVGGAEHELEEYGLSKYGRWIPWADWGLFGYHVYELAETNRKAHEEIEKRLNCTD